MVSRPTDHRSLDLCQFNEEVAFQRAQGRILWQPRILAWYTDRQFSGTLLPAPFTGMTEPELYRHLGVSNRLYFFNEAFVRQEPSSVTRRDAPLDEARTYHEIRTPAGTLTQITRRSENHWDVIPEKWWIETPEDMKVATWLMDHSDWGMDQAVYDRVAARWGRVGAPTMYMPRVNVQHLYIDQMGVERAVYALYEWGSLVTDFFKALHGNHLRLIEVVNRSPIRLVNFGDNLHCATLSPRLFEEYVLPAYLDRSDHLHRAGKFISSHWDGDTKTLLKYAKRSGLDAIEALTPVPQGDVTLEEIKSALGDDLFLMDGIPAVFFDERYPEEELLACAEKIIKLFAPKLILGISDEISSTGNLARIHSVTKLVDDYNAAVAGPVR